MTKTTIIEVAGETLTYCGEKYIAADEKEAKLLLEKFGVAVIPDRLTQQECEQMNDGMWSTVEHLTSQLAQPVVRSKSSTYRSVFELMPKAGGLFQHWGWGHAQYVWDVRSHPKVATIFEHIFNTTELLVSFDGVNCGLGPLLTGTRSKGLYKGKKNLHCDQRFAKNSFECVQTWVTANPTGPGDGTLRILEGSHLLHKEFNEEFQTEGKHKDWHVLTEEQIEWYKSRGCQDVCLICPAGAQVCWDSRTIHCGMQALKTVDLPPHLAELPRHHRNVVYVCMTPASLASKENRRKRRAVFEEGHDRLRMASHWPQHMTMFPSKPRCYGPVPNVPSLRLPSLTERGRRLAGSSDVCSIAQSFGFVVAPIKDDIILQKVDKEKKAKENKEKAFEIFRKSKQLTIENKLKQPQKDRTGSKNNVTSRDHEGKQCDSKKRKLGSEMSGQQMKKQKNIESYFVRGGKSSKAADSTASVSTLNITSDQATTH